MIKPISILRLPQVQARTGLARSTIYALIARNQFPAPLKLTEKSVGWDSASVERWIEEKIEGGAA